MSIFCSLVTEDCNIFHSQSTVKTLESASQLPYRHMLRQLSCFPSEWSIQEKWRWTSPWRIWIYLNLRGAKGPGNFCLARIEAERRQAAYEQIKAYVLEKTGLKVSSLYIAQIKKKCGLDVGENFNPAKSENARQPHSVHRRRKMRLCRHLDILESYRLWISSIMC